MKKRNNKYKRIFSTAASAIGIVISGILVQTVFTKGIQTLSLGGWKAPYGIVLAADQFASLLVLTTAIIGLLVGLYSFRSVGENGSAPFTTPAFSSCLPASAERF